MNEFWRWAISAGITVNLFMLALFLKLLFSMKKDVQQKLQEICKDNKDSHAILWKRVDHHAHTENGKVIITE